MEGPTEPHKDNVSKSHLQIKSLVLYLWWDVRSAL